jgi:hypothetical protein
MRYDDRETAIESDDRLVYEMMEAEAAEMQKLIRLAYWIADVVETASAVYDPTPEYLDQDWLDKGNY